MRERTGVMPEVKEVSRTLVKIWLHLQRYEDWTTAAEVSSAVGCPGRTVRHHLLRLTQLGLLEQRPTFGGFHTRRVNPLKYTTAQIDLDKRILDAALVFGERS